MHNATPISPSKFFINFLNFFSILSFIQLSMAGEGAAEREEEKLSVEQVFKDTPVPPWGQQITGRSIATSVVLSLVFNVIVCKLNLTTGIIPSLNVAAGLLGYGFVKLYTKLIEKFGLLKQPFTRQENTVIQTCVVASSGIAFSSGTASYLLAMSARVAAQADAGNTPKNVMTLGLGQMYGFLLLVSFIGLFSIVPLRKLMILKYKLTYPSGTATAYLVNSFHTPKGSNLAKKQVAKLFTWLGSSFLFAGFQWFFSGPGDGCGFSNIPTFGLKAFEKRLYFDFSTTYVGVGMISPYMVNISLLIGAVLSWGIMWPLIENKKGDWYSADIKPSSLHGIQGYRIFLAVATMLGDGLFQVVYMIIVTSISLHRERKQRRRHSTLVISNPNDEEDESESESYDDKRRKGFFLKDQISNYVALGFYVGLAIICMFGAPLLFKHRLKWYHILVAYLIAPVLAFCNSYGTGLTDWSLASNYGKIAILVFSAWVGLDDGGVVAGLAACGVIMSIVATASDLMQDFKTGYLTLSSPLTMFCSQAIGTALGVLMTPAVFWFFYKAYPIGDPEGSYPAPYALMYRGIALLGVEGFSSLPKHCVKLAIICFFSAIALNLLTLALKHYEKRFGIYRFIPSPMCMAIPFYIGGYFAIDMCVGSLILFVWKLINKGSAEEFGPAVASGLICGESLWSVPAAVLALAGAKPPICFKIPFKATSRKS